MVDSKIFSSGVSIYDSQYVLKASKDKLTVFILPQTEDPPQINIEKLHVEMNGQGIVHGLLPALEENDNGSFTVARGTPAVDGEDAKIVLRVKPATFHPPEAQLDKDRVDFKDLHSIVNVQEGKVLAEKIPPTSGSKGKDIFGFDIQSKPGKDRSMRGGNGVKLSESGDKLVAAVNGKFVMVDKKPTVMTKHVVMGNVDFSVGNLVFGGELLTIHGEVMPGFSVKCRGDVEINNGINNATVIVGGSLTVKQSIVGEETLIKVRGDFMSDFIENGPVVECHGNMTVKNYIFQSKVRVGKDLIVKGEGTIVGGSYITGGSIMVKELGSDAGVHTELTVGINLDILKEKQQVDSDFPLWSGRLNELIKANTLFQKQKKEGTFDPENEEKYKKYSTALPKLMEKVDQLNERAKKIEEELEQMIAESVYISDTVFPGVVIKIGNAVKSVTSPEKEVVAYYDRSSMHVNLRKMSAEDKQKIPQ